MRRFASFFLAAVLGSVCTVASYEWVNDDGNEGVKIEYVSDVPTAKVSYTNKDGEAVPLDFTIAAERVMPAVVHIRSKQIGPSREQQTPQEGFDPFRDFFPRMPGPSESSGSGVIINENGYIITNNHVVQDAEVVEVSLTDNRTFKAEVVGTDPDTDIAVIKINQKGLPHLSFVDSDQTKIGEWVLAVGNPFNLNSTVTAGIISAKGRSINILSRNVNGGNTAIESFIQTDAAINPGNSGGALVNLDGGLIGINTAIASPTGSYSGYGFAVPSNIVSKIVEDILQFGEVQRGWLGVSVANVSDQLVREHDLQVLEGAYISAFAEKSSAREAGLKEGDVVTKIDNTPIKSNTALIEYIGRHRPGDKVNVTVNRAGKEVTIPVVLKNRDGKTGTVKRDEKDAFTTLGIELEDIDQKVLNKLDIPNGIRVKSLANGKLTRLTDLREGFIIIKVNDTPVKSVKEFTELLKKKKTGELIILSGTYEDFPREFNYAFRM
ncbi:MAG: Do family serine endopeptidase [Bacteroidota bacterium]